MGEFLPFERVGKLTSQREEEIQQLTGGNEK